MGFGILGSIFGFLGMGIGMIINLGIVIGIIYLISKAIARDNLAEKSTNALELLRIRYAKGEIDEDEYFKRLEILKRK